MKCKLNKKSIIAFLGTVLLLFNFGITYAFWASSIQGDINQANANVSIGSWQFLPPGFVGVSQNGNGNFITLDQIGTPEYPASGNYKLVENINYLNNSFTPIANFSGQFHGDGFVISNLTVSSTASVIGIFAQNSGLITQVGFQNINISSSTTNDLTVGGVVGNNMGTISFVYSTGSIDVDSIKSTTVNNETMTQQLFVGGIAGLNSGTIHHTHSSMSIIADSTASAASPRSIVTANTYAGGLVGRNASTGSITISYATGSINASATGIRSNGNSTSNAYSYAGGLVGENINTASVSHSFAIGNITSVATSTNTQISYAGGLIGQGSSTTSYRLNTQSITGGTINTTGISTTATNLQSESFVTANLGWSTDNWLFQTSLYPRLKSNLYN
ncbi:GLUG motif-containing protein [Peloplasma aerotolerans]|uniref:GLUG motif-containing protein n=1 Tax=Peloplasma aerotolerans TaxID=3044389 RepID=A0AAW6U825_9MOLU|nr:GLUG motif-containing protein [Mariniplasma sp. M4Ah]MDI6452774.1 GLUG motif-containing protein [Mariniplasma sp. M4Ah]